MIQMKQVLIDGLILGGSVIGQAGATDMLNAGSLLGRLAPSALLGIGIVWAIRRGDNAIKELRETRDKHEKAVEAEREEFKKILRETTEALVRVNRTIEHCENSYGGRKA